MQRITHATRLINANGPSKDGFSEGAKATQTPATIVSAAFLNSIQEELCNVVTSAGLTLNVADNTQLSQAIAIAATGSASANAISIRGTSVLTTAPTSGDVIQCSGSSYAPGKLTNANVSASAGISVSKLSGSTDGFVLGTSAGIPVWQNGAYAIRGVAVATSPASEGYVLGYSAGSYIPNLITNTNVSSIAGIAPSKLAAGTVGQVISVDSAGAANWANQEFRYLLSAQTNDLAVPDTARFVILGSQGSYGANGWQLTGIVAPANANATSVKVLVNPFAIPVQLMTNSPYSALNNRFNYGNNAFDVTLPGYGMVSIVYTNNYWSFAGVVAPSLSDQGV